MPASRRTTRKDPAALFAQAVEAVIPNATAVATWTAFLRAHASLMRRLDSDLRRQTGAGLSEFDILATLAIAGGSLRMAELAQRAYSSRSSMTHRVDNLVEHGLLRRGPHGADGRGVVVSLTDAGVARLGELAAPHLRGIEKLFVARLNRSELGALHNALRKVTVETSFG